MAARSLSRSIHGTAKIARSHLKLSTFAVKGSDYGEYAHTMGKRQSPQRNLNPRIGCVGCRIQLRWIWRRGPLPEDGKDVWRENENLFLQSHIYCLVDDRNLFLLNARRSGHH